MNKDRYVVRELDRFVNYILDDPRLVAMLGEHQGKPLIAHFIEDISRLLQFLHQREFRVSSALSGV